MRLRGKTLKLRRTRLRAAAQLHVGQGECGFGKTRVGFLVVSVNAAALDEVTAWLSPNEARRLARTLIDFSDDMDRKLGRR